MTEYEQLTASARELAGAAERLPIEVSRNIAAEAAAASRRTWRRLAFPVTLMADGRSAGLVASLAACLLAVVALPLALRQQPSAPTPTAVTAGPVSIDRIDMTLVGDSVRLAWSDGANTSYRVYKSSDPRGWSGAEVHSVRGTVWIDQNPASSPIVYYRIEAADSPQF